MLWKKIAVLSLLAVSVQTAATQDTTPTALTVPFPEVVIYEPETGALYNITAEGTQSGANMSDVAAFAGQNGYNYMLSPDRAKLVFAHTEMTADNMSASAFYVADVATGACCTKLDPQDATMNSVMGGQFSDDGTQFLGSYFSNDFSKSNAGQLVVFDLASGSVVARLDGSRLDSTRFNNAPVPGIMFSDWTPQGVTVMPSCVGCEPPLEGMAQLWNPADDSLSAAIIPYSLLDQKLGTGERLRTTLDTTFPNNPDAVGMLPVPNVVTYTPPQVGISEMPPVVYFNPDNIYINQAIWVADGLGILVIHADRAEFFMQSSEAYVLLRDGTKIPVMIPLTRQFLAATSDGWVMSDQQTKGYIYYRLTGATVEEIVLDAVYNGYPVVVESPRFGASAMNMPSFPLVTAPLQTTFSDRLVYEMGHHLILSQSVEVLA